MKIFRLFALSLVTETGTNRLYYSIASKPKFVAPDSDQTVRNNRVSRLTDVRPKIHRRATKCSSFSNYCTNYELGREYRGDWAAAARNCKQYVAARRLQNVAGSILLKGEENYGAKQAIWRIVDALSLSLSLTVNWVASRGISRTIASLSQVAFNSRRDSRLNANS